MKTFEDFYSDSALIADDYKKLDFFSSCIFTGERVDKKKGEHVIPRWMLKDYQLKSAHVEMAQNDKTSSPLEFQAPATTEANGLFGNLENKVKQGSATKDEIHIWSRKISVGVMLNHHRMSLNVQHPQCPVAVDERCLRGVLQHFHSDFKSWKSGAYSRNGIGSVIKLKTAYDQLFFAHLNGAIQREDLSNTHDVLAPYGLVAIGRNGELIIATYGDSDLLFERPEISEKWETSGLIRSTNKDEIRCFLAVLFFDGPFKSLFEKIHEFEPRLDELQLIGYQLGIQIIQTSEGLKYTSRKNTSEDNPIFFTTKN